MFIPALLAISVSGFKLYKSIIKDKQRENIKNEVFRHTIFSLIMIALLVSSSLIEIFISTTGLKVFVKFVYLTSPLLEYFNWKKDFI